MCFICCSFLFPNVGCVFFKKLFPSTMYRWWFDLCRVSPRTCVSFAITEPVLGARQDLAKGLHAETGRTATGGGRRRGNGQDSPIGQKQRAAGEPDVSLFLFYFILESLPSICSFSTIACNCCPSTNLTCLRSNRCPGSDGRAHRGEFSVTSSVLFLLSSAIAIRKNFVWLFLLLSATANRKNFFCLFLLLSAMVIWKTFKFEELL